MLLLDTTSLFGTVCLFTDQKKGKRTALHFSNFTVLLFKEHYSLLPSLWEQFINLINHFR